MVGEVLPPAVDSVSIAVMNRLLFAWLALPMTVLAEGGLPNQPYIYVEGRAEIEKPADMVTLRFDLVASNPDQAKANQEVQSKAVKILGMFNERKVAENDVIAADLRSEPQYEGDDEESSAKRGKVIGYTVTRSFKTKVRDVTAFAKLVDELLAIGGVEFSAIDAGFSKENEMQDEVSAKALTNARERAAKTLATTGMKIDSVFAISPVTFPEIQKKIFGSYQGRVALEEIGPKPDPSQYRLPPITVSQSVHVIYLISPAK